MDVITNQRKQKYKWIAENPLLILPFVDPNKIEPIGIYCPLKKSTNGIEIEKNGGDVPLINVGTLCFLSKEDTLTCIKIGKERNFKDTQNNSKNMNYCGRNDEDINIQGVLGEFAFCKLFKLPIEIFDTTCRSHLYENRFDAVFPNGWTVDVKTTIYDKAELRISEWKSSNPPDLYSLMILTNYDKNTSVSIDRLPIFSFKGMITSKEAIRDKNLKSINCGNGEKNYYCIPQKILKTFQDVQMSNS